MTDADSVLMTRLLFIDALIGVGVPTEALEMAVKEGLATAAGMQWNKRILETLQTEDLQDLYTRIKLHEINHAHKL